jgi:glycosyltransferase involved in cell wall biosynthesis
MSKSTAIIIPCYHEGDRLNVEAFTQFITTHDDYLLCFVNDGSKDHTINILNEIKSAAPDRVDVIDLEINVGKAEAVRVGALHIANNTQIPIVGFIDADLSTDFRDFKALVHTLEQNEDLKMVYGSRNSGDADNVERNPFRKIFSNIVKAIINLILGLPIADTQCGAKVFKREIIAHAFDTKFLTRWLFDVEIFIKLKSHFGNKNIMNHIYEQPLLRWIHVDDSKLGVKDALQIPYKLLSIWYSYNVVGKVA